MEQPECRASEDISSNSELEEVHDLMKRLILVTDQQTQIDFLMMLPYPLLLKIMEECPLLDDNPAFWQTRFAREFPNLSQKIADPYLWQTKYQFAFSRKELDQFSEKRFQQLESDPELIALNVEKAQIEEKIQARTTIINRVLDIEEVELKLLKEDAQFELESQGFESAHWVWSITDTSRVLQIALNYLPSNGNFETLVEFIGRLNKKNTGQKYTNGHLISFRNKDAPAIEAPDLLVYIWRDSNGNLRYDSTRRFFYARKGVTRFPLKMTEYGDNDQAIMNRYHLKFELTPREN